MLIAILNQSTLVSNLDDASTMTQAVARQIRTDAAPLWDRSPRRGHSDPTAGRGPPPEAHGIVITDTIQDQPEGVLGFHTEDKGGKLWGIVAAKPELDNGGKTTTCDWSVSSVLLPARAPRDSATSIQTAICGRITEKVPCTASRCATRLRHLLTTRRACRCQTLSPPPGSIPWPPLRPSSTS